MSNRSNLVFFLFLITSILLFTIGILSLDGQEVPEDNSNYASVETKFGCLKTNTPSESFEVNQKLMMDTLGYNYKRCG